MPLVVHLPAPIYSRPGKCILLASLLGAIFGLRSGGAASAWAVSFCPCYFLAIEASSENSLCLAVVIVRAMRAAVVAIGSCQSVPSIKACCSAVLKTPTECWVT